jgi:hypothetical protein
MALSIRYNNVNRQASGLSGRRTRTPLVKKYADRVYGLNNRVQAPTLAPPIQEPPVVKPRVPFDSGPGIGPGEGAVGGIETGSTFGNNPDPVAAAFEDTAMANMPIGSLFGGPAVAGAKGAASTAIAGGTLSHALQAGFAPALALTLANTVTKGPIIGTSAARAAKNATELSSDLSTDEALNLAAINNELVTNPTTAVTPANQALTTNPQLASIYNEFNQQKTAPTTPIGLAVSGIKGLAEPGPDPQIAIDPSQTGGFNFGGRSFGSGSSPGLDAATQADMEGDPSLGMGRGGVMAGNAPGGGGEGDGLSALCTSLFRQGLMGQELYLADVHYAGTLGRDILDGYYTWALPLASWMDKSKILTFILKWPILKWAENMAFYGSGAKVGRPTWFGKFAEFVGFPICKLISKKIRA